MSRDLLDRLRAVPAARPVLEALAGEEGVHVVGGAVRDVLLGRQPHELDIVVEGDAGAVARRAAERLGGQAVVHERFGTATVRAGDTQFDLASARRERYPRPGALPEVELGATLTEDLRRRDFTVNAIAVAVTDGAVTEVPGARDDLAAGLLRVLHERSFEDDPTRMLRLVRYATRLGFEPDPGTAALIRPALLETVTAPRIGAEIALLLREPLPDALVRLEATGLAATALHPGVKVPAQWIEQILEVAPSEARADLAALGVSAGWAPSKELAGRMIELGFRSGEAAIVRRMGEWGRVCDALNAPVIGADAQRSDVGRVLRHEPLEVAVVLATHEGEPCGERARWWLEEGRHVTLDITGDDLVAAGLRGPAVGAGLDAAMAARLDGTAPDRESQLRAALS